MTSEVERVEGWGELKTTIEKLQRENRSSKNLRKKTIY
jgi:hypothetical protein